MTIGRLCEGEVRELSQTFDVRRSEEAYLTSIEGKTAALMSAACRIGALTAGLERPSIEALTTYGARIGMAFQIVDDVLDIVATEEQLGKPAGNDLMEGVYTLPVIITLAGETDQRLHQLLGKPLDRATADEARAVIRSNGAVGSSLDVARDYARQATDALEGFPEGPAVQALRSVGDHLIAAIPV
jgi:heptaprenyl diphosphate synthase